MKTTPVDAFIARETALGAELCRETLTDWQLSQIRRTLRHAQASPFYRRHLRAVGEREIEEITSLEDLGRLPLMSGEDVRREGLQLLACSQSEVTRLVTLQTSGSTGKAKRIGFTEGELAATRRFFLEGMKSLLQDKERVLVLFPAHLPGSVAQLLQQALSQAGHPVFVHWPPGNGAELAAVAMNKDVQSVVGLPTHLLALAENLGQRHPVRTMLLCADYAPSPLRQRIEARGITTFLHYGSTESGFGGAVECQAHGGCHLWESALLLEVIDPVTASPLPEGQFGELVLTTLNRRAMPLLRLRTGDFATMTYGKCRCGGVSARIDRVGRQQRVILDGGVLESRRLDALFFAIPGLLDYRAKLTDDGLDFRYLAEDELSGNLLPELPAGLEYGNITRFAFAGEAHTVKRVLVDCRREAVDTRKH